MIVMEALAVPLDRTFWAVRGRIVKIGLTLRHPRWTRDELAYLNDNYGLLPATAIGKRLGRSLNSLKLIARRRLNGINQRTNFYSARSVAELLGISCAKTIVFWVQEGYIKGTRSCLRYGKNFVWRFDYDDIMRCLRRRPWLVRIDRMERSYFRSVVQNEYERNRWYTCSEAAPLLGLIDHNAVKRYIRYGWLPAEKRPGRGAWQGEWVIRQKDIDSFLKNDPRPEHRRRAYAKTKRNLLRRFHIKRTYWAKKMATTAMVGRGVRVNRCPIGRKVCHLACHFRGEDRCHYSGPVGRKLARAKRRKKERR